MFEQMSKLKGHGMRKREMKILFFCSQKPSLFIRESDFNRSFYFCCCCCCCRCLFLKRKMLIDRIHWLLCCIAHTTVIVQSM